MELDKRLSFSIEGKVFLFRSLTEEDVTQSYIEALRRQRVFLDNNPDGIDMRWQRNYVLNIRKSKWDTICGMFTNSQLIGTSGIQNIKRDEQTTLGIFVLSPEDRGKGHGKLLVWSSCYLINQLFGTDNFGAGVKKSNVASLRSFLSCGFRIVREGNDTYKLVLRIENFETPAFIRQIAFV